MAQILADIIWPALFLEGRLLSIPVILAGLLIEYFFVWRLTDLGAKHSAWADLAMNAASTLPGIVLIPTLGLLAEFFPGMILHSLLGVGTFGPVSWAITFCLAVLVNALIETFVLSRFFKQRMGKRGFGWLCAANALSVGAAFLSFFLFPIQFG